MSRRLSRPLCVVCLAFSLAVGPVALMSAGATAPPTCLPTQICSPDQTSVVINLEDPNSAVAANVSGSVQTFGGVIAVVLGAIMGLYVAMLAYKWLRRQIGKGVHAKA